VPKGVFVVQSSAVDAAHEPAYDDWYRNEHIPQVLEVPGFVGARRFRVVDGAADAHTFLTIYEIDSDDVRAPLRELFRRTQSGAIGIPEDVRSARLPTTALYELIGDHRSTTGAAGAEDR